MAAGINSRGAQVIVWAYVTIILGAIFVALRLYVRWKIVRALGKEDGTALAAWVCRFEALVDGLALMKARYRHYYAVYSWP
jgi:hypothetical protein